MDPDQRLTYFFQSPSMALIIYMLKNILKMYKIQQALRMSPFQLLLHLIPYLTAYFFWI